MGKLFVIDGTDGSGKQTQLEKLKQRLTQEKIEFKVHILHQHFMQQIDI